MATHRANDPRAFQGFLDEKLSQDGITTLDEALSLWDYENLSEREKTHSAEAIRQGRADVEAGRVIPAREALAELRKKHNLSELT